MTLSLAADAWPDRVALVTGGAARIGAAIVRTLHNAGYRIVLHYRQSATPAEALAAELNALRADSVRLARADLVDLSAVEKLADDALAQWQRLDLLVHNASSFYPTALADVTAQHWEDLMSTNARAPLFLAQRLAAALRVRQGCIVHIVDSTAQHGLAGFAPYAMAKAALANLTRTLARELAPEVRVNGVSPGAILWPEYEGGMSESEQQGTLNRTCLGRLGTPEDIAGTVLFLTQATYVTGQIIRVDGGALA